VIRGTVSEVACDKVELSGTSTIDSRGLAGGDAVADQGHALSAGDISLSEATVIHGDATTGPDGELTLTGTSYVTGTVSTGDSFECHPIVIF